MTIKAILFDKDGTLIDFTATFGPATALVIDDLAEGDKQVATNLARACGYDMRTHAIDETSILIAGSLENIVATWLPYLRDASLAQWMERVDTLYEKHSLKTLAPFDCLNGTLKQLGEMGLTLGIATNDSESTARAHMEALDLTSRFQSIIGFDSGFGEKPGPGMITAFVQGIGLTPTEVMMVGDSTHDLLAANAAGVNAVAVTSGLAGADTLAPHADHILPDIGGLPKLVEQFNRAVVL